MKPRVCTEMIDGDPPMPAMLEPYPCLWLETVARDRDYDGVAAILCECYMSGDGDQRAFAIENWSRAFGGPMFN